MFKKLSIVVCALLLGLTSTMVPLAVAEEEKVVNVYNWFEYLPAPVIERFEKETGIKVVLDTFESMDVVETKLLTGKSGYDLVMSGGEQAQRLVSNGLFAKLDKSKLTNYGNLDPGVLASLAKKDKGNTYGVPYMWGTTGIIFNEDLVRKHLPDANVRSLDLIFKSENMKKLAKCGVAFNNEPFEVIPIALNYLGLPPYSTKKADLKKAEELLESVRPYIRHFNTGQFVQQLATGELCAVLGYNGEAGFALMRAEELKNGIYVDYSIPDEGTLMWFDFFAIPADAPHKDSAHKLLDFLMRPKEIAEVSNTLYYPNGNTASLPYILDDIKGDPDIYPPKAILEKLFTDRLLTTKERKKFTRLWTNYKAKR